MLTIDYRREQGFAEGRIVIGNMHKGILIEVLEGQDSSVYAGQDLPNFTFSAGHVRSFVALAEQMLEQKEIKGFSHITDDDFVELALGVDESWLWDTLERLIPQQQAA